MQPPRDPKRGGASWNKEAPPGAVKKAPEKNSGIAGPGLVFRGLSLFSDRVTFRSVFSICTHIRTFLDVCLLESYVYT